jgi:lysine-specific demethylase/histidyl-hydroxylase NO66
VELFVCQTAGEKRWRLYQPWQGFALPAQSSADLPESRIGAPTMDITLRPGDVLYMPRGVIHQAAAQQEDSTHLTISTYQRWTWGDLASSVIQQAILVSPPSKHKRKK